jgi:membrane-associated PAP2 superfamily phosphatase
MGEKATPTYLLQLKAMLIRNLLLKKRAKRKTIAVSTVLLVYMKLTVFQRRWKCTKQAVFTSRVTVLSDS